MAIQLAVGDILQLTVHNYQGLQAGLNVLHYEVVSFTGLITDEEVAIYFDAQVDTVGLRAIYPPLMAINAAYYGVQVQKVFPTTEPPVISKPAAPVIGTAGSIALPYQCTGLIKKIGQVAGRHGRGRTYIPFPAVDDSSADPTAYPSPIAGYLTRAQTLAEALFEIVTVVGAAGSVELNPIIYNRLLPAASVVITGWAVRPLWATQRRRSESGKTNQPPF